MIRTIVVVITFIAVTCEAATPAEVTLRGTARERGRVHGTELRESIRELAKKWKADLAATVKGEPDAFIARFISETQFDSAIRRWTPELLDEVRGIAEGAGLPYETVYAMQMLDELWWYASEYKESNHCSTIGVARSAGQPTHIAQNMDLEKFRDGHQVVLRLKPDKGPEQLLFTSAGLIVLNGVNEHGIAVVVNTLAQLQTSRSGLPVAFVIRGLLSQTSEEKAIQFLTGVKHASGQNYLVGTPEHVFDYEASAGKVVRYRLPGSDDLVFHTNHPLVSDDFSAAFLADAGKVDNKSPRPLSNSVVRLASLDQRLRLRAGRPSLSDITETLRSRDSEHAVCRRVEDTGAIFTFGSVVMTLSGRPTLRVSAGPPDQREYVTYSFE